MDTNAVQFVQAWTYQPEDEAKCVFTKFEDLIEQLRMDAQDGGWMDLHNNKPITITPFMTSQKELDEMPDFPGW